MKASHPLHPYPPLSCFQLQNLFYTEDNTQSEQTRYLDTPYDINIPENAMRMLRLRMPTITEITSDLKKAGEPIPEDWSTFNRHRTDSVDYIYVLSGAITYIAGKQQIALTQGDFLAQVRAEHTWVNNHDEPCMLLCVMKGIKETGTVLAWLLSKC